MSLKIMAVDDDPPVLKFIKFLAESWGCEVLAFEDSQEAARRVNDEKFDGFLLDVEMPQLDGFGLAKHIRSSPLNRTAPIVMLTGLDDVATMRLGFKAGATCFLGKPISKERFYPLIKAMRGPMLEEKRRYIRLPYRTNVTCKPGPHFDQKFVSGSLTISEGGLSLAPAQGLDSGQELDMEFKMPDFPPQLKVRGRVVRREPPDRASVEFLTLTDKERGAVRRYIEGGVDL
jgi:CheY-like chemotaxis protein